MCFRWFTVQRMWNIMMVHVLYVCFKLRHSSLRLQNCHVTNIQLGIWFRCWLHLTMELIWHSIPVNLPKGPQFTLVLCEITLGYVPAGCKCMSSCSRNQRGHLVGFELTTNWLRAIRATHCATPPHLTSELSWHWDNRFTKWSSMYSYDRFFVEVVSWKYTVDITWPLWEVLSTLSKQCG